MKYDVIIVGAGPGGSSAATFLTRQGLSTLLLDRAAFPRPKVCGDGLTPQAIYWLAVLGCVDDVLARTNCCITSADFYVNGEFILTGNIPQDTMYPGFFTLLEREQLDAILVRYAVSQGAHFKQRQHVRNITMYPDGVEVEAQSGKKSYKYRGRLLIGADGANSIVSRTIGNKLRNGTTAVSVRTYFDNVTIDRSQFKVFFDELLFPGYGWLFADDDGKANVGLGYGSDSIFTTRYNLKAALQQFIESDLKDMLRDATPRGQPAGWWSCFYRPRTIVADRVMLVGDAAHFADPLTGGGIHKAIESAYWASTVASHALSVGDCSAQTLARYQTIWSEQAELDWRTSELILSIAKNPHLKEFFAYLLSMIGKLSRENPRFREFCTSVFIELTDRSACLSPFTLLSVIPLDPGTWLSTVRDSTASGAKNPVGLSASALRKTMRMTSRIVTNPVQNFDWGLEVANKTLSLLEHYASSQLPALSPTPVDWAPSRTGSMFPFSNLSENLQKGSEHV